MNRKNYKHKSAIPPTQQTHKLIRTGKIPKTIVHSSLHYFASPQQIVENVIKELVEETTRKCFQINHHQQLVLDIFSSWLNYESELIEYECDLMNFPGIENDEQMMSISMSKKIVHRYKNRSDLFSIAEKQDTKKSQRAIISKLKRQHSCSLKCNKVLVPLIQKTQVLRLAEPSRITPMKLTSKLKIIEEQENSFGFHHEAKNTSLKDPIIQLNSFKYKPQKQIRARMLEDEKKQTMHKIEKQTRIYKRNHQSQHISSLSLPVNHVEQVFSRKLSMKSGVSLRKRNKSLVKNKQI